MNRYSGVREKVKLPQTLSNPSVLTNIIMVTKKIIDQVELENQFSRNIHSICQHLSQSVQKSSSQSQSKFNSTSGSNSLVCKQVVKIVYMMFRHLEQQAFKNQITLKTISKTERDEPLFKSITDKCDKIKQKTEEYIKLFNHYETAELTYIEKTEKFENVEANPIKYFSVDISSDKINRIKEIQVQLQRTLQRLKLEQISLQNMYKQIKKLLAELMYTKIKRMYETITLSREVVVKMMTFEDIIIQQGSKDYLTNISDESPDDYAFSSTEQAIVMAKKMLQKERMVRHFLEEYILSIKRSIQQYKRQLVGLQSTALGVSLNREKKAIQNKIGTNLYYDKIESNQQIQKFCGFLQKLVNKIQIDKIIHKYRKAQDQTLQKLQTQIKALVKLQSNKDPQQKLKSYANMKNHLEKKYRQQFQSINSHFKQDVLVLIKMLKELRQGFLNLFKPYQKPDQQRIEQQVNQILISEQYKILSQPFLISNEEFKFFRSPYIDSFLKNKNQDVVENISVDLDSSDRNSQAIKNVLFNKTLCCGNGSNDKQIIDQFNCALVNKILLQGKLVLYKKLIKFTSIFNRSTFLGKTKIKIPIKDIVNIDKDNNFINGIYIQTTHGILRFSSFLTNPIPVLKYYYVNVKGNARGMIMPEHVRIDQRLSIQPTQIIRESPQVYVSGINRTSFANKMVEQGFIEKGVNQMYRLKNNGNSRVLEVVKFLENENEIFVDVQYSIEGKRKQNYHCEIKRTKQGKVNSQYQFSETSKIFQQDFVQLMRVFMNKPQKRNANLQPNLSISSIAFDNQNLGQTRYQKIQPNTFNTMTPVQTIRIPNSDNSINQSPPQSPYNSRVFSASHISVLPKKSLIRHSKQVTKQQANPIVLYIIIGMIVFALAIII